MGKKDEQEKPLAPAVSSFEQTTLSSGDVEVATRWKSSQYLRKRRCLLCCCGCCAATVVVLGIIVLVLALTVFTVKDPVLTMNSLRIVSINAGIGTLERPVTFNATLNADISIKNPNAASFRFDNSSTEFYYRDETVGVAYAPDGEASAHRTVRMNVTVDVLADRLATEPNVTSGILGGGLDLSSITEISGRVNLLGVYKKHMDIVMSCTMTVDVLAGSNQEVKNKVCKAYVKH